MDPLPFMTSSHHMGKAPRRPRSWLVALLVFLSALPVAGPVFCQPEPITLPPIGATATYDLDLVDLFLRLFPERYEAEVIAVIYLSGVTADNPVLLRCEGYQPKTCNFIR